MSSHRPSGPIYFVLDMIELYFTRKVARTAAALAYFLVLSFFPAVICVNAILGSLHLDVARILDDAAIIVPDAALTVLTDYVGYITTNQSGTLLTVGLVTMIWLASAAMRTLMGAIDEIYGRTAYKGIWFLVASLAFSALFLVTIYLSLVVLLTGNWFFHLLEDLIHRVPRLQSVTLPWDWQWLRFLILFAMVFLFVLLVYRAAAPREKPRPPIFSGALLASIALVGASMLFSHFIGLSSRYSLVYGSLASVIILLVWLYLCGNIVILGSCFNRVWYGRKKARLERENIYT